MPRQKFTPAHIAASAPQPKHRGDKMLCGINAIHEALRVGTRRIETIWLATRTEGKRLREVIALAAERETPIETVAEPRLTEVAGTTAHQGIVAFLASTPLLTLEQLTARLTAQRPIPPLVVLDGVQDPRNLGAIIRSAAAFGIGGVIVRRRRAVGINATVAKAAAGGLEYVAIAEVTNIAQSLERLKQLGFWIVGTDEKAAISCQSFAFPTPLALTFGQEGWGISPLVKRHCDVLVQIPVCGPLHSLNVAVAAAVLFYEVKGRERRPPAEPVTSVPNRSSL